MQKHDHQEETARWDRHELFPREQASYAVRVHSSERGRFHATVFDVESGEPSFEHSGLEAAQVSCLQEQFFAHSAAGAAGTAGARFAFNLFVNSDYHTLPGDAPIGPKCTSIRCGPWGDEAFLLLTRALGVVLRDPSHLLAKKHGASDLARWDESRLLLEASDAPQLTLLLTDGTTFSAHGADLRSEASTWEAHGSAEERARLERYLSTSGRSMNNTILTGRILPSGEPIQPGPPPPPPGDNRLRAAIAIARAQVQLLRL